VVALECSALDNTDLIGVFLSKQDSAYLHSAVPEEIQSAHCLSADRIEDLKRILDRKFAITG
jgi:hypothetical protein